jgi:hypothetical protein
MYAVPFRVIVLPTICGLAERALAQKALVTTTVAADCGLSIERQQMNGLRLALPHCLSVHAVAYSYSALALSGNGRTLATVLTNAVPQALPANGFAEM